VNPWRQWLIGIAISEGILGSLDQTLRELLPQHRASMSDAVAAVTLRQLMTMTGGFPGGDVPYETVTGTQFLYSNLSSHLVAAVLATALRRSEGDHPRSLPEYARVRLFEPLGIDTDPAWVKPLSDTAAADFLEAGFGWGTDPKGIPVGAFGLRLTAPDLVKLGELYRHDGAWQGKQIFGADWVEQVTTPGTLQPQYGLMWWGCTPGTDTRSTPPGGTEGQLIVVVPDQRAVITILSANNAEYVMNDEALFPLLNELIIPRLDGG
jgi:CubicO group peptidase (beta-lactamase class C family)